MPLTELNASAQGLKSYKWDWDGMGLDGPLNAPLLRNVLRRVLHACMF